MNKKYIIRIITLGIIAFGGMTPVCGKVSENFKRASLSKPLVTAPSPLQVKATPQKRLCTSKNRRPLAIRTRRASVRKITRRPLSLRAKRVGRTNRSSICAKKSLTATRALQRRRILCNRKKIQKNSVPRKALLHQPRRISAPTRRKGTPLVRRRITSRRRAPQPLTHVLPLQPSTLSNQRARHLSFPNSTDGSFKRTNGFPLNARTNKPAALLRQAPRRAALDLTPADRFPFAKLSPSQPVDKFFQHKPSFPRPFLQQLRSNTPSQTFTQKENIPPLFAPTPVVPTNVHPTTHGVLSASSLTKAPTKTSKQPLQKKQSILPSFRNTVPTQATEVQEPSKVVKTIPPLSHSSFKELSKAPISVRPPIKKEDYTFPVVQLSPEHSILDPLSTKQTENNEGKALIDPTYSATLTAPVVQTVPQSTDMLSNTQQAPSLQTTLSGSANGVETSLEPSLSLKHLAPTPATSPADHAHATTLKKKNDASLKVPTNTNQQVKPLNTIPSMTTHHAEAKSSIAQHRYTIYCDRDLPHPTVSQKKDPLEPSLAKNILSLTSNLPTAPLVPDSSLIIPHLKSDEPALQSSTLITSPTEERSDQTLLDISKETAREALSNDLPVANLGSHAPPVHRNGDHSPRGKEVHNTTPLIPTDKGISYKNTDKRQPSKEKKKLEKTDNAAPKKAADFTTSTKEQQDSSSETLQKETFSITLSLANLPVETVSNPNNKEGHKEHSSTPKEGNDTHLSLPKKLDTPQDKHLQKPDASALENTTTVEITPKEVTTIKKNAHLESTVPTIPISKGKEPQDRMGTIVTKEASDFIIQNKEEEPQHDLKKLPTSDEIKKGDLSDLLPEATLPIDNLLTDTTALVKNTDSVNISNETQHLEKTDTITKEAQIFIAPSKQEEPQHDLKKLPTSNEIKKEDLSDLLPEATLPIDNLLTDTTALVKNTDSVNISNEKQNLEKNDIITKEAQNFIAPSKEEEPQHDLKKLPTSGEIETKILSNPLPEATLPIDRDTTALVKNTGPVDISNETQHLEKNDIITKEAQNFIAPSKEEEPQHDLKKLPTSNEIKKEDLSDLLPEATLPIDNLLTDTTALVKNTDSVNISNETQNLEKNDTITKEAPNFIAPSKEEEPQHDLRSLPITSGEIKKEDLSDLLPEATLPIDTTVLVKNTELCSLEETEIENRHTETPSTPSNNGGSSLHAPLLEPKTEILKKDLEHNALTLSLSVEQPCTELKDDPSYNNTGAPLIEEAAVPPTSIEIRETLFPTENKEQNESLPQGKAIDSCIHEQPGKEADSLKNPSSKTETTSPKETTAVNEADALKHTTSEQNKKTCAPLPMLNFSKTKNLISPKTVASLFTKNHSLANVPQGYSKPRLKKSVLQEQTSAQAAEKPQNLLEVSPTLALVITPSTLVINDQPKSGSDDSQDELSTLNLSSELLHNPTKAPLSQEVLHIEKKEGPLSTTSSLASQLHTKSEEATTTHPLLQAQESSKSQTNEPLLSTTRSYPLTTLQSGILPGLLLSASSKSIHSAFMRLPHTQLAKPRWKKEPLNEAVEKEESALAPSMQKPENQAPHTNSLPAPSTSKELENYPSTINPEPENQLKDSQPLGSKNSKKQPFIEIDKSGVPIFIHKNNRLIPTQYGFADALVAIDDTVIDQWSIYAQNFTQPERTQMNDYLLPIYHQSTDPAQSKVALLIQKVAAIDEASFHEETSTDIDEFHTPTTSDDDDNETGEPQKTSTSSSSKGLCIVQ